MNFQEQKNINSEELAKWNDEMVLKHHKNGTLFESKNPLVRLISKMRLKKLIKCANLNENDVVLDLGCGEGFLISFLPPVKKVIGIDISKVALKRAGEILRNKTNVQLLWGDAQNINLADESFDKIFCSETLEHLPEPHRATKEIYRLLKKGGMAIISIPDEKRSKLIMKIAKLFLLDRFLHTARKEVDYDWHLHQADKKFIFEITKNLFNVKKIYRVPPFIGNTFVAVLEKQ